LIDNDDKLDEEIGFYSKGEGSSRIPKIGAICSGRAEQWSQYPYKEFPKNRPYFAEERPSH